MYSHMKQRPQHIGQTRQLINHHEMHAKYALLEDAFRSGQHLQYVVAWVKLPARTRLARKKPSIHS